ncbi:hypothetical protein [Rhizobium tropici]|uniref:hypothetical protein n=1 Tax=Rhizobium tropici TaxID=398 RepID=UPI0015EBC83D
MDLSSRLVPIAADNDPNRKRFSPRELHTVIEVNNDKEYHQRNVVDGCIIDFGTIVATQLRLAAPFEWLDLAEMPRHSAGGDSGRYFLDLRIRTTDAERRPVQGYGHQSTDGKPAARRRPGNSGTGQRSKSDVGGLRRRSQAAIRRR